MKKLQRFVNTVFTFTMAFIACALRLGWCLISSSMALPRLDAVSPIGSEERLRLMAGR